MLFDEQLYGLYDFLLVYVAMTVFGAVIALVLIEGVKEALNHRHKRQQP